MGNPEPERGRRRRLVAGLLAALPLAGCADSVAPPPPPAQDPPPAAAAPEPAAAAPPPPVARPAPPPPRFPYLDRYRVRVALLLPLSGPRAALGQALLDAAELAVFDRAGPGFALLPKDTGGTPEGAAAAMRSALADGADAVLGPLFAHSARAAAAVPRPPDVPVVAFTNDRRAAEDGVYVLGLAPAAQVDRAVAWALAQGRSRFGALAPRGPFGEAVAAALRESAARRGGAVGRVAFFAPEAADAPGPIESLAAAREDPAEGFDALLVAASGRALAALVPQLPYRGLDPADAPLLGTAQWRDPAILGEPALLGAVFAAPEEGPAFRAFAARYRDAFGAPPPPLAALAYDAAALAARLAEGADGGGFAGLVDPSGFAGAGGLFRFGADRVAERGLAIYRVARDRFEVVDPAPRSFAVPAF